MTTFSPCVNCNVSCSERRNLFFEFLEYQVAAVRFRRDIFYSARRPFSACDTLLLTIFVGLTLRYCSKTKTKKLRYEKETKYSQHMQFTGKLELAY